LLGPVFQGLGRLAGAALNSSTIKALAIRLLPIKALAFKTLAINELDPKSLAIKPFGPQAAGRQAHNQGRPRVVFRSALGI
jgi:hypothetical protein